MRVAKDRCSDSSWPSHNSSQRAFDSTTDSWTSPCSSPSVASHLGTFSELSRTMAAESCSPLRARSAACNRASRLFCSMRSSASVSLTSLAGLEARVVGQRSPL